MDVLCLHVLVGVCEFSARRVVVVVTSFDLGGGLGGKLFSLSGVNPPLNVVFVMVQVSSKTNSSQGSN